MPLPAQKAKVRIPIPAEGIALAHMSSRASGTSSADPILVHAKCLFCHPHLLSALCQRLAILCESLRQRLLHKGSRRRVCSGSRRQQSRSRSTEAPRGTAGPTHRCRVDLCHALCQPATGRTAASADLSVLGRPPVLSVHGRRPAVGLCGGPSEHMISSCPIVGTIMDQYDDV